MQQRDELELLRARINIVGYSIVAALGILLLGFWHFQMIQSGYYTELAERNRIKLIPLLAPRGRITDREGRTLVDNRPSYNVILTRENSQRSIEETAALLSPGIGMTVDEILEKVQRRKSEPKFRPIVLKEDVAITDIAFVESHQLELPEISVEDRPRRKYLYGTLAAHALGYMGEVTESELQTNEFKQYQSGDEVGRAGMERTYNSILRGTDGYRKVVVDKFRRVVETLGGQDPTPGNNIRTTIDLDLQRAAEDAIGDRTGAAVAIDPHTGEVLVLASKPAFDPNLFATRISTADFNALNKDPRKPFRNRAVQDAHSPGSVFKIFMAAAGLEAGTLNPLEHIVCTGAASFYGHTHACWKSGGHGNIGLYDAIVNSCNVFFYNVGRDLGIDKIARSMAVMGLGRTTGIDLPNESAGLIPSPEWKRLVRHEPWYQGETISVSIGQGAVGVTPLQATSAMAGLASGGRLMRPHFVPPETLESMGFQTRPIIPEQYSIHQTTVDIVSRAMWGVVNEGGTGTQAAVKGFDVAGKTGTAQVVGKQSYGSQFEDNAWFVGFAPYRNPDIAVGVFIEHGGHGGSAAAPVAHAILETYYKKKTGQFGPVLNQPVASLAAERDRLERGAR